MSFHKVIRIIAVILALFSVALCVYCGLNLRDERLQVKLLQEALPASFMADLTTAGKNSFIFQHSTSLYAHGCVIFIKIPAGMDRQKLIHEILNANIDIRLHSNERTISSLKNAVVTSQTQLLSYLPSQYQRYIPFVHLDLSNAHLVTPSAYQLTFTVHSPSTAPELKNCSFLVKYEWCFLEKKSYYISLFLFILSLVLTLLLCRIAIILLLSRRKHTHNPQNNRILYLLSSYPRWSETFIRLDLKFLEERTLPITIASLFPGDCDCQPDWPKAIPLSDNATNLPSSQVTTKLQHFVSTLLPRSLKAQISLFKHRHLLNKLLQLCRDNNIGHIHAEFADLAALLGSEAARLTGCTFSIGIHAIDVHRLKYPSRTLFGNVSFITSCNLAAAKALYHKCPWLNVKMHLIHHGVDLSLWKFMQEYKQPKTIQVLFIGRLVPKKGVSILLQAIAGLLHGSLTNVSLTIVGEGPMEDELKQLADELNITNAIIWKGRLPQTQLPTLFQSMSCLCVPSIVAKDGDQDGLPNVITEAFAAGLPVVGSQAGSIPEILSDKTGWPVNNITPVNLASTIVECTSHPDEMERRRKNARKLVEYNFDAKKLAEKRAYLLGNVKASDELFVK